MNISWGFQSQNSIGLDIDLINNQAKFYYSQTAIDGTKIDYNYSVGLDSTRCNFGGQRYWFRCSSCGRRVRALFYDNQYFTCRHCMNLSYRSRQENNSSKFPEIALLKMLIRDEEKIAKLLPIKKTHYKGQPTKRYQKYLVLQSLT